MIAKALGLDLTRDYATPSVTCAGAQIAAAAATIDDTGFGVVTVTAALAIAENRRELERIKETREPNLDAVGVMVLAIWISGEQQRGGISPGPCDDAL